MPSAWPGLDLCCAASWGSRRRLPLHRVGVGAGDVGPAGGRGEVEDAGLGLGECPARELLDVMVDAAPGSQVAAAGRAALIPGPGVIKVGVAGWLPARRLPGGLVAGLDVLADQGRRPVGGCAALMGARAGRVRLRGGGLSSRRAARSAARQIAGRMPGPGPQSPAGPRPPAGPRLALTPSGGGWPKGSWSTALSGSTTVTRLTTQGALAGSPATAADRDRRRTRSTARATPSGPVRITRQVVFGLRAASAAMGSACAAVIGPIRLSSAGVAERPVSTAQLMTRSSMPGGGRPSSGLLSQLRSHCGGPPSGRP